MNMRKLITGREYLAAAVSIIIGVAVIHYGQRLSSQYYQSVAANLGTGLILLGLGITLVNVYFDYHSRQQAVRALLQLITPSLQQHHNALLDDAWNTFGKAQFGELLDRYKSNKGDPLALTPEERKKLYALIKEKKGSHDKLLQKIDSELQELVFILGWSFNPQILAACFSCRFSIAKFLATSCDDTDQSMRDICEQFLDSDIAAHAVYYQLVEITGKKKEYFGD